MGNESLVWVMVFSVLLATSRAQDGREEGEVVSAEEPEEGRNPHNHQVFCSSFLSQKACADFFVSPQGHDGWSGRLAEPAENDGPFATIKRAQEAVRALLRTQPEPRPVRVVLRGGTYYLDQTLEFGPEDSGTEGAPVVYAAAAGEKVIVSGGRPLSSAAFKPVDDPGVLARLPEEARDKVMQVDLRAQGITDFGVMRPHGQGRPVTSPALELFFNDQSLPLARWPNRGTVPIGQILDPGSAPREGDFSNRGGTFTYDYDRPARWTQADDIWLSGYFAQGYAPDTMKVKSIDLAGRSITLVHAHRYGLKTGQAFHTYYALNLLEEIDEPGEWYLDRKSGLLYLWPPSDIRKARIVVSLLDAPMVAMEGASCVTLRGITFETSRGMGIYIERGNSNLIAGCTFRNLGLMAVFMGQGIKTDPDGLTGYRLQNGADQGKLEKFEPASRELGYYGYALYADPTWNRQAGTNHGVVGCDIYNTGAGGIVLGGGDRKILTPGGNYVLNCHLHHFTRLDGRVPAISIDGVGNRVAHCLIHDAPLSVIQFTGNDHVIEFNEVHDVCLPPVYDMGAFYMGRDPSEQGNVIRNNFFHHLGNPQTATYAVYLDDGACGTTVSGNVFYKVQTDALAGWGHNHLVRNNVFIDTRARIPTPMNNAQWRVYMDDPLQVLRLRKAINVLQPPYVIRYPGLAHLFEEDPNYPRRNVVHDNLSVRSGDFGEGTNDMKDNLVTDEAPGFVDMAGMNFQFKADSPVWTKMPGFQRIPFERIGLYTDEYRKVLPADDRRYNAGGPHGKQ